MSIYSQLTSKDEEEKKKQQGMKPSQIAAEQNKPKVSLYQQLTAKEEAKPVVAETKKPSLFESIKTGVSDFFSKVSGKKKAEEVFGGQEPTKLLETKPTVQAPIQIQPKNIFDELMGLEKTDSARLTPEVKTKVDRSLESNLSKLKTVEEKGKVVLTEIAKRTSGTGIEATIRSASPEVTFQQAYEIIRKSQREKNDTLPEQFLTGLKDTLPQTALGIALGFVPLVGPSLTTSYWAAISAGSEIEEKGYATPTNVVIDVVGDRMLGGMIENLFKTPAKSLLKIVKKAFVVEGGTEVAQDIAKFGNEYRLAKSDEERGAVLDQAKQYFTSGQILVTAGVGGVSGGGIATVATGVERAINKTATGQEGNVVEMTPEAAIETVTSSDLRGTNAGNTIIATAQQAEREGKMVVINQGSVDKNAVETPSGNKISVSVSEAPTIVPKVTEEKQVTSPEALKQTEKTTPVLTDVEKQKQLAKQKKTLLETTKVGPEGETVIKKVEVKPLTEETRTSYVQMAKESSTAKSFLNKIGKEGAAQIRSGGDTVLNFFNESQKEVSLQNKEKITGTYYRFETDNVKPGEVKFFSKQKDYAEEYGKVRTEKGRTGKLTEEQINLNNPLVVYAKDNEMSEPTFEKKYIDIAIKQGNDGVVFRNGEDEFIARIESKTGKPTEVTPVKKKQTLSKKVNIAKNVTSIKSALRSVRKQFSELVSEAEGKMAVAKEQREGLNTKDIAKLKLAYNRSQRFQEGDIETMRDSKFQPLVDRVVEDVQIKYPDLSEEEAFDFALNLPTKAEERFVKTEDMARLMDRQKVLQGYLNTLEEKQAKITGQQRIEEGNAVFDEWRSVMDQQEKLTRLITAQERQTAVQKPIEETQGKPKLSRVAERVLNQLINVQESDITYKPLSIVEDAAKATEFSLQNPEIALRIAKGLELPPPDITETAISIAMAERARRDGDFDLYSRLIASRTLRQTRRGQEIVVERGRMDENSSEYFMKQLLAERARIVESGKGWKYAIEKKAVKIQNIIKEETTKLKQTIDKKVLTKLESAQKLIDSLTCKI